MMKVSSARTSREIEHGRRDFVARMAAAGLALPPLLLTTDLRSRTTTSGSEPQILSRSLIFKHPNADPYDPKNLYGFNHATSVITLPDGRLLAAWFSGPFEAAVNQVILGSFSSDGGRTWSRAKVLQNTPTKSDFDPAFIRDGRRTWFFYSVGRWNRYPVVRNQKEEVGEASYKTYYRYSDDSGRTWSEPTMVLEKIGMGCRSNGIKLSSGELILPIHGYLSGIGGVLKSSDGGKTWRRFGEIKTSTVAVEPSIAELPSGDLMMVLRTRDGFLWQTFSRDKGETWTEAEKTDIVAAASSHNLLRLRDGRIVLTHNESKPPLRTPLTLRVSSDGGKTWGTPVKIAEITVPGKDDPFWGRQVSYPSATQLEDGTVVVVWGEIHLSDAQQYGDIYAARVRV